MSEKPNQEKITPATPEQAQRLLDWAVHTTETHGIDYGHCNGFGEKELSELPEEISKHFPAPDPSNASVRFAAYITRNRDHQTHTPRTVGVLANIAFSQKVQMTPDLLLASHVNYHLVDHHGTGTVELERHVAQSEHGPHKVREFQEKQRRNTTQAGRLTFLQELITLRDTETVRIDQARAAGQLNVSFDEARQIMDTCALLSPFTENNQQ